MSVPNLLHLNGHTALVTGAGGGLGAAIAKTLAAAGARVILHYNTAQADVEKLRHEISVGDCVHHTVQCDVSKPDDVYDMINTLAGKDCLPDLLVNNAGVQGHTVSPLLEAGAEIWNDINDVNLGGVYALTRSVAGALIKAGRGGAIVNIASIEGLDPAAGHAHYAASKAALIMYTRACALELGIHNIRVNAVAPGLISRPGIENDWPEGVQRWRSRAPLSRLGRGEDIANGVLFLLSPAAVWISGNTLCVDGGMSAQNRW